MQKTTWQELDHRLKSLYAALYPNRPNNNKPKAIDLFCGCGGMSTGLEKAGFQVLGAVDSDLSSIMTYKMNHPHTMIWKRNIRKLDPREMLNALHIKKGDLDLLVGCPPCQGFSSMRYLTRTKNYNDPRNDLLFEFVRFIKALWPQAVLMENVPGLVKDRRLNAFCQQLEKISYRGSHRILDAADYGVPQHRRRLVYLAGRAQPIPFPRPSRIRKTVRGSIGALSRPGNSGDPLHDALTHYTPKVLNLIQHIPPDGGSHSDLPPDLQIKRLKQFAGLQDVYGRLWWDKPAPTITGRCNNLSSGRYIHPDQDRIITLREAALLQSFPHQYKLSVSNKDEAAKMIGNAVPPLLAAALGRAVRKALQGRSPLHRKAMRVTLDNHTEKVYAQGS